MTPWSPLLAWSGAPVEGRLYLCRYLLVALGVLATGLLWRAASRRAPEDVLGATTPPIGRRRSRERALLLASLLVSGFAMLVSEAALPAATGGLAWGRVAGFAAIFLVAHAALVAVDHRGDPLLLPAVALLAGLSNAEILRLDAHLAGRQMIWTALGVAAMLGSMAVVRDYRRLADHKYVTLAGAGLLQASAMVLGTEINGARLWIRFGSMELQPVELVKILLVVFLAAYLAQNRLFLGLRLAGDERRLVVRALLPFVAAAGAAEAIFVLQKDLGQGLLFFGVCLAMFHATTRRAGLVLASGAFFVGLSFACYHVFGHVRVRFAAWLDPWRSPEDWGFQMVQGLYALASGGGFGSGLGRGQPWRIPAAVTDFIYPSMVEEMGVVTGVALLACFWVLVARALKAAREARDPFGSLLATGVAAIVGWQTFVIVAGTTRMLPMTGITLPFVSYGGSSLLSSFMLLGLLLQITHRSAVPAPPGPEPTGLAHRAAAVETLRRCFALLLMAPAAWLLLFTLRDAPALARSPENPRTREDVRARGTLVDRDGRDLAWSSGRSDPKAAPWVEDGHESRRAYIGSPAFGNLVGYDSRVLGTAGLERALDARLKGSGRPRGLLEACGLALGWVGDLRGEDVRLTLDAALQRHALELLASRRGAIVALDPSTGEILALASSPGFDPNDVEKRWSALKSSPDAPLLNRALEGTYPPGSVIKPVVVAAALDRGVVTPTETFSCSGSIDIGDHRFHDAASAHGTIDLTGAIAESCNVTLARIGLRLGASGLLEGLRRAGFGEAPRVGLSAAAGRLPRDREMTDGTVAQVAFGQGPLLVTPLQVALATAAVAHGGRLVMPRLERAGSPVAAGGSPAAREVFSEGSARRVGAMMEAVVERGTGTAARVRGIRVAGKTGTAENPHGPSHAWFAGFAPAEAPRVVVVILVENGGSGGHAAAPLAPPLIEEALGRRH